MSRPGSSRIYLADIVVAVVVCALGLGLVRSIDSPAAPVFLLYGLVITLMLWAQYRGAWRGGPICADCGQRFVPLEGRTLPTVCPQCGAGQVGYNRAVRHWQWILRGLVAVFLASLGTFIAMVATLGRGPHGRAAMIGMLFAMFAIVLSLLAMLFVILFQSSVRRPIDRSCEACGENLDGEGPRRCPDCLLRRQGIEATDRARTRSRSWLVTTLVLAGILIVGLFAVPGGGSPAWLEFTFVGLALMVAYLAGTFGLFYALTYSRILRLRTDRGAIALARDAAGEEGEIVRDGGALVWYAGPDDPTSMIREETADAHRAFEMITELPAGSRPLRWLVFHDHRAFRRFHQRLTFGIDLSSYEGLYLWYGRRLATLCTEAIGGRIPNLERTVRSMVAQASFNLAWGLRPPTWLQTGLPGVVALAKEPETSLRLNRKMIAALASGSAYSTELFNVRMPDLTRMLQGTGHSERFQRLQQFAHQAASIVEYLVRDDPGKRAMGAFLTDRLARSRPEAAFLRHFGRDESALLDDWRGWVARRGIGPHLPPSSQHREAIVGRVLPVLRDPGASPEDRILALRSWAVEGHAIGAEGVISLLDEPGTIPKEEAIWALRMVSGMTWGDEPGRWRDWYKGLPDDCRNASELIDGDLSA